MYSSIFIFFFLFNQTLAYMSESDSCVHIYATLFVSNNDICHQLSRYINGPTKKSSQKYPTKFTSLGKKNYKRVQIK